MNQHIAQYVSAYQNTVGSPTEKVKHILMHYSHTWGWGDSESLVSDLIDDTSIEAQDIVDFLSSTYEIEGGSTAFRYAVQALQVCLRKDELERISNAHITEEDFSINEDHYESDFYTACSGQDLLNTMQY